MYEELCAKNSVNLQKIAVLESALEPGSKKQRKTNKKLAELESSAELETREDAMKFGSAKKDKTKTVNVSVLSILNKLCPDNYEKLSKEIMTLNWIESEKMLRTCTQLLFEKAIDEPHFSGIYADLCLDLTNQFKRADDERADDLYFRKFLVEFVREQFQNYMEIRKPDENGETDVIERLTNKDAGVIKFRVKLVEAESKALDLENKMSDERCQNQGSCGYKIIQ